MIIDFMKEKDTFLGYCLINGVTHKYRNIKMGLPNLVDGVYDVQFIVNGVELPLIETFEDIKNQIDRMVREKALELLEEKFGSINDLMYEVTEELKRIVRERLGLLIGD